jgi:threonine aldolase
MNRIDFRSDTVTAPTDEMREYMLQAPVGDDVFMEDPTVNALQSFAADLFGMEDALFCASGTQTNQIAINVHVRPGGEIICHEESHIYKYEGGGIAKNSGASVRLLQGNRGRITANSIRKWINPDDVHFPVTALVSLEDTANRGGGSIYDFEEIKKIRQLCTDQRLPLHLDGARLMNALAVTGFSPREYAKQFDSISLCLSKGLGAPVGSILLGTADFIKKSRRVRKVMGGGMRQAGMIAAGGLFALQNNIDRLKDDHLRAKKLESTLNSLSWVKEVIEVQTNIVVIVLKEKDQRDHFIQLLKQKEIMTIAFGEGMIRMVTHLNISDEDIDHTCFVLKSIRII